MSEQEYENLWHYSEQFSRDPLQRSELITMAYVMGKQKMGDKVTPGMMKSVTHYRSKELNKRSACHTCRWPSEIFSRYGLHR